MKIKLLKKNKKTKKHIEILNNILTKSFLVLKENKHLDEFAKSLKDIDLKYLRSIKNRLDFAYKKKVQFERLVNLIIKAYIFLGVNKYLDAFVNSLTEIEREFLRTIRDKLIDIVYETKGVEKI